MPLPGVCPVQVHDEGCIPKLAWDDSDIALTFVMTPTKFVDSWRIPVGKGHFAELPSMLGW